MRKPIAIAQAGLESLRWIRDEAEFNGYFSEFLKNGDFSEAALLAMKGIARAMPRIDVRAFIPKLLENEHDCIGMGAEAIVIRNGAEVHKYLTGKCQEPEVLKSKLRQQHDKMESNLGGYLAPTSIDVVRTKLFKGLAATDYVRLTQPLFDIEHIDPHLDPKLLVARPEIAQSLRGLSTCLVELFENEGLLLDVVSQGNLIWGHQQDDQQGRLYVIDTLPVDLASRDFMGINVPFWIPQMHLEYLADFANANNPAWLNED